MGIKGYISKLNIKVKTISKIEHEDAISSDVYKVVQDDETPLILKIFYDSNRYRRELYFLNHLNGVIPVSKVIDKVEPQKDFSGRF
jgi:hypothetical protein